MDKYNYVNNDTQELLLKDKDNEPLWLDSANIFKKYQNGIICAYVELNDKGFYLTPLGELKNIN